MFDWIWEETDLHLLRQEGDVVAEAPTEADAQAGAQEIAQMAPGLILDIEPGEDGWGIIALDMSEEEEEQWLEEMTLPHWVHGDIIVYPATE